MISFQTVQKYIKFEQDKNNELVDIMPSVTTVLRKMLVSN